MINNQWYAVLSSHEVKKGCVVAARRFGQDLVFFRREDGILACVQDLCAHRGASLGCGAVRNGNIQCPFHGIEYAADGRCVHIPSEGVASEKDFSRFNLRSYELREIGGIVFAWYGNREPVGEPLVFDVVNDPELTYDHINDTWPVQYSRVIENQLDVSHLAFVHRTTIGRGNKTLVNGPKVVWLDDNTLRTSANNEVDSRQLPKNADQCVIKTTNLTFKFPNMWLNHVTDKIQILAFFIPVDEERSIIALRFYNRITPFRPVNKAIAWLGSRANKIVERQDKRVVRTQLPKASALSIGENLVAADLPIVEYRRRRHELQMGDNGISIKPDKEGHTMDNKAMFKLSYGLFVLTAKRDDKDNGCITNTAIQVTSEPNRIAVAVNKANYTHDMVMDTKKFNVSILSEKASFDTFKHFGFQSGRDVDKFAGYSACKRSSNGLMYVTEGTNAYISVDVEQTVDLGTHTLFIGAVTDMEVLADTPSATYTYYQENIKPKPEAKKDDANALPPGMHKWRCKICGFEYIGETLPDDYICEICKHPASDFELVQ